MESSRARNCCFGVSSLGLEGGFCLEARQKDLGAQKARVERASQPRGKQPGAGSSLLGGPTTDRRGLVSDLRTLPLTLEQCGS